MTNRNRQDVGTVSELIRGAIEGRLSRREILRRAAALGVAAPMVAAMLKVSAMGVSAAPAGAELLIGCPYNLTGGLASIDNPARDGSMLAAKLLNAGAGVLGRPVKLVVDDGKTDLTANSNITKKMIEEDKVVALVGLTDTDYVRAAGTVAQQAKIPFLDVGGTAPIIEAIGDYIFMVPFGDNVQAAAGAEFANEKGWKTCAVLFDKAMTYATLLGKYFKDRYTDDELKGMVVKELEYQTGDTDFSSQMTDIKNLDPAPDFVYISSGPAEIGTIIKQARDAGIEQPIMGGDGYDTPDLVKLAGDRSRNVYFTTHQGIYGDSPKGTEFATAYQTEYGKAPEAVYAALGFDGINLMADAINRAGATDGAKIKDALGATQGFQGATGTISYAPGSRIPQKSVALIEVKDGKFTLISIVVPKKVPAA